MTSVMTTNSQLSTKPKNKNKLTTGTESQKWRPHGVLLVRRGRGENGGKGIGNKKHNW